MAISKKTVDTLGPAIARSLISVRRALDQLGRRMTDQETDVFLGAVGDSLSPTYLVKIAEATVGLGATKSKTVPTSSTVALPQTTVRGQFVAKPELFDKGRTLLATHKAALLGAISAGNDTHTALTSAMAAESFEIAAMVQVLVHEGVIEVTQQRRTGKRPIQKYRLAGTLSETPAASATDEDPALKERVRILVSTRGESFVFALSSGPLTSREMARKIAYSVEDTELLAQELCVRGRIVVEQAQRDGQMVPLYSLPRPRPSPTLTVVHVEEKAEVRPPADDEAWRNWANEKRMGSPNPLSFNQLTQIAHRRFGTSPDWQLVFDGLSSLPSINGRKPFKIDWDEELVD